MSVASVGYKLSPQQKRVWQLLLANNMNGYVVEAALLIEGRIEPQMIENLLDRIVQRHEILRTGFQVLPEASIPIQIVIDRKFGFDKTVDISHLSKEEQEAEVRNFRREARRQFLESEQEGLIQATLITLSPEKKCLFICLPAICSDRTGFFNLLHELARENSADPGQELNGAGLIQYADLAGALNNFLESDDLQEGREYWREQILPELFETRLSYLAASAGRQEFIPRFVSRCFGGGSDLLRRPSQSLRIYLLACYAALLYRLTGSSNLMIGTAYSIRSYQELADTIGPLGKYLPIRCQIEPCATLIDVAQQLDQACQEAEIWQESFTWDDINGVSDGDPGMLFFPFQFEYWEVPEAISAGSVRISLIAVQDHRERFDLKLCCVRHLATLEIQVHYDHSVLSADVAARFADEMMTLIESATAQESETIYRLNILSRGERDELLTLATAIETPIPVGEYIHNLIDRPAFEAIAVGFEDVEVSYSHLSTRSNQLAAYLQSLGVEEDVQVGVYLNRSPDAIVGILGILKSGGVYVPLDPEHPRERLTYILRDAGVDVILTHSDLAGRLPDLGTKVVCLDAEWEEIASRRTERDYRNISQDGLAYVIYTSGSTGDPKGVGVSHRNLLSSTMARRHFYQSGPERFLLLSPLTFDSSIAGIFWTLLEGGTLVLTPGGIQRDPIQLARIIAQRRISHTLALPSLYQYVLEAANPAQTSSLQVAIVAGEVCPSNLPRLHQSKAAHADLVNEYGPTEGAVWSTAHRCAVDSPEIKIPIGRPITNASAYVVETSGELAPMGVAGELFIDGPGIARGYLNRVAETAEKFVPNPFSRRAGERMYKTGDLVRWTADESLEFLGRIDHQVKIRGYRLELGEIEAALSSHFRVRQSAVMAKESEKGNKRLIGYVVGEEGITSAELKKHVRDRLPEYMVPDAILILSEMPLTANGKIDRKQLPSWEEIDRQSKQEYIAARTSFEELLVGIFEEVLKLDKVGVRDNFFEIGGHSLLAMQMISRLRDILGIEIGVKSLFDDATVEGVAVKVEEAIRAGDRDEAPPLVRAERVGRAPLSFAQQRLWFLDQLIPNNPFYNCPVPMRLEGRLNLVTLERVINEIVRRHEALRTRIEVEENEPVQVIDEWEPRRLLVEDLTSLDWKERVAAVRRIVSEDADIGFDLRRGPFFRVKVLRLEEEQHVVLFTIHHIVSDRWSIGVLVREVRTLYQAYCAGEESPLKELTIQYADYAIWQRRWLQGEALARQLRYWREQLADLVLLELPTDHPRPALGSYLGSSVHFRLPEELARGLKTLSRREGATLFMTLLAVFQVLLARYSRQEQAVVGSPIANRNRGEIEGLIGFFVNMLVMRADLRGNPPFTGLLKQVKETALGAYARQDLPFEKLVEELHPERALSHNPLFQVTFALQNIPHEGALSATGRAEAKGENLNQLNYEETTTRFDLELYLLDRPDGLNGMMVYSRDLFEEATVRRMVDHFENMLRGVVVDPDRPISELPMLSEAEEEQLALWNKTHTNYPADMCVHQVFEAQSARTPERIAVISQDHQVSYAEVNRRADRLARYLRQRGVGPEVLVGLCPERNVELIVGMLAILKAGGAYVPLDPTYPQERLAFMLADTAVPVVLTDSRLARRLPESRSQLIYLDEEWEQMVDASKTDCVSRVSAENLAYVIYTSGSTGQPKGVCVPHRGVVRLVKNVDYAELSPDEVFLQLAPISFDASTFEIWGALLNGARLALFPARAPTPEELGDALARYQVTALWLTSGLFHLIVEHNLSSLRGVRQLLAGGDVLSVPHVLRAQAELDGCQLINGYGPTENTTFSCCYRLGRSEQLGAGVPIGRPISNTQVYALDKHLQLAPVGVAGELYLGGDGLARGYLNRPELTAERFVEVGALGRLYRTGDLCRWRADGVLEFLGRLDDQVKIRGFRIEPGEIETVLKRHAGVKEAVVALREDVPGEKRLVGYVVSNAEYQGQRGPRQEWQEDQVRQWTAIFDDLYERNPNPADPTFNIVGWNSSYTGAPLPASEMREWLEDTINRIETWRPRRILEIGCGTGMLLFHLAPHCLRYLGTDFSQAALDYIRRQMMRRGEPLPQVELWHRSADEFHDMEEKSFDAVILNSVAQYFPEIDYLVKVLRRAVKMVAPGGRVFVGDVRSLPLLRTFHTSVEMDRAEADLPLTRLRQKIEQRMQEETELVIDPSFFLALSEQLPEISRVDVMPKRGWLHNELTQFRYQVIIEVGGPRSSGAEVRWLDWKRDGLRWEVVKELLANCGSEVIGFRQVPNTRLSKAVRAMELARGTAFETVGKLRELLMAHEPDGVEPEAWWELGAEMGYELKQSWMEAGAEGSYHVVLRHNPSRGGGEWQDRVEWMPENGAAVGNWQRYANHPLREKLQRELGGELKSYLEEKLPDYMIPSAFVFLDSLPITPNGKVDRKGLPALASTRPLTEESFVAPRDILELQLVQIWERVLGIQPIGVTDNFFDLGGHSLLAAGLMTRIRNIMRRELPLSALFQGGTIESLAAILRREAGSMSWSCLVELQAAGSQPPLFFAHPGGGNVLCYLDLSRCLGPDQPFYGFQTPGLYGERALYTRIEDLAAHYIEAMKTIQPEGPYFVGGWSLGGIVAYEMAQQLISRGQAVGQLLLLDSGAWALGEERLGADADPGEIDDALQLMRLFAESLQISKEELGQFEGDQRIEYVLKRAGAENLIPPGVDVAQARSFLNVYRVNGRAMRKYAPQVYPGAVTLFKTSMGLIRTPSDGSAHGEQIAKMVQDPTMGWGELAAEGVRVVEVTGNHQTMMKRPHVETLALSIKTCLNGDENIDL